ncbi:uncharacterized protein si:dkey-261j15.2 [Girardinichthys multiradiatus]|uniref:uncharacterized protein si:dkey-261j15.2 n=1 Tax=Girardinichthys multiradiatus TaxID=208333 RepID=UPI001FAC2FA5|nr:uncharacterized protein si:dkey-261j15.2 [Girardinichthys multiradiatus]XP_047230672.1 uncharacterized protein si:dkey-261j15.2 [Girardinichthys multiradiatus]XP_047230673.1 uncharacterized protein si:dkey-261j15.2 [Girardinichthys multiradiatus]XP_047230674.1 uncharacterized protein si:dkey-261j15.2 [Girardinichthys multiradiatus]XP_047230675.1 uncharacterized protein si:dkey-261j15.2 [Girardinichthys multiradiatus]
MSGTAWEVLITEDMKSNVDHKTPHTVKMKEELKQQQMIETREESEEAVQLWIFQDEEQVLVKQETKASMVTPAYGEIFHNGQELQQMMEKNDKLELTRVEKELKEAEPVDIKEPEPAQIKEEQNDLCSDQDDNQLAVKDKAETFTVASMYEQEGNGEPEPSKNQPYPFSTNVDRSPFRFPNVISNQCHVFSPKKKGSKARTVAQLGHRRIPGFSARPVTSPVGRSNLQTIETMAKMKNVPWSVEETQHLILFWACPKFQVKLESSTRKEKLYGELVEQMEKAGYFRSKEQIVNKLKKMKKEYRDAKKELSCSGVGRINLPAHYAELDNVLGCRPANQLTGVLESRETPAPSPLSAANDEDSGTSSGGPSTSQSRLESTIASEDADDTFENTRETPKRRAKKRKTNETQDILEYFKSADARAEERENMMLQHMEQSTSAMLGLLERMVKTMEEKQPKYN